MTAHKDDPRNDWRGLDIFNTPTLPEETIEGIDAVEALESFGGLGPYGITSAELPAVSPAQVRQQEQAQRDAWLRAQKAHSAAAHRIAEAYRQRRISPVAYDLLQDELSAGYAPDVYQSARHEWMVWSDREQRRYTLGGWERNAQELLPVSHPDRETHVLRRTPSIRPTQRPSVQPQYATQDWQRPWSPLFDSGFRGAPTPRIRNTPRPVGMPAGFGVAAPATVPLLRDDIDPEKRGLC